MNKVKMIVGVWNFENTPFKWGNCMLFNQSLHLLKLQFYCPNVELVIYADPKNDFRTEGITKENYNDYIEKIKSIFLLFDTISVIHVITSKSEYDGYLNNIKPDTLVFPPGFKKKFQDFDFKSYLRNQEFIEKGYKLSFAKIVTKQRDLAKQFINKTTNKKVISVHLRYDESFRTESNAILPVWLEFIRECENNNEDYFFCFIGNDLLSADFEMQIRSLNNTIFTKDHSIDILNEFGIISESEAFMGIASGPSNVAILSKKPYLIIKHPKDAWIEKFNELVNQARFPFAFDKQHFKITNETSLLLHSFLKELKDE